MRLSHPSRALLALRGLARECTRATTLMLLLVACAGGSDLTGTAGSGGTLVRPAAPSRIELSTATVGLGAVGATEVVSAIVRDPAGNLLPSAPVSWSSSDITVADVNGTGTSATITARAPGRTIVRATSGSVVQEVLVNVTIVRSIVLPASVQLRAMSSRALTPTFDAEAGASTALRWESADATIASVSNGVITGVQPGSTTIRAIALGDARVSATTQVTVVAPRSVTLVGAPTLLFRGDEAQLSARLDVDAGDSEALEWSTSSSSTATINATGRLTAVGVGAVTVRVRSVVYESVRDSVTLQVRAPRLVLVSPTTSTVAPAQTLQLTASVQMDPGMSTAVTWRSATPSIAMVSSNGLVTGVARGTTIITAVSLADTTRRGSATITVEPQVRAVSVQPASASINAGSTRQFTAAISGDAGASTSVIWRSANPAVAQVSAQGVVTGVSQGSTTIIAIAEGDTTRRATAAVTILPVARDLSVQPEVASIAVGANRQFTASVVADPGASTSVIWRSSNVTVARVSSTGLVSGVAHGTATISVLLASDTTKQTSAEVTVVPMVRAIAVDPTSATLGVAEVRQLTATVSADPGASTAVTWRSSNPAVASVNATGAVASVAAGTATITAVAVGDTTRRATSAITVRNVPVVTVSPAAVTLAPGAQRTLVAAVQADPGVSTAVTWRTNDASVATVSGTGQVNAISNGSAIITAVSVADSTRRASSVITVNTPPSVRSVSVSPTVASLQTGQTVQLIPTVEVAGGASAAVTYRSDNPAVANVNTSGLVTALGNGTTTITVTATADPTKTASASITVANTPTQLATSWSSARLGGALHEDVVSIDAVDASIAFAVNSRGDVFQLAGGSWVLATRGSAHGTQFRAVSASSGSNAVAVGTNGVIVRFDGSSWTRMSSSTQQTLHGVHLESASVGFAVGSGGLVLRLNGSSWSGMTTGSSQTLYGVWTSGSTGFAVGSLGELLRWNGSAWSRQSSLTTETLQGVHGISANSAVAVGTFGTVLRWNGSNWNRLNSGSVTGDLYNVAGSSADGRYYVAGDDGLYTVNNNSLSVVNTPYAPRLFGATAGASGAVYTSGQRGIVMRLSGSSWTTVSIAPDLIDVWTTAANNAWAVGEFGFVYRWNGSVWSRQTTPTTTTLNTVWAASASDAFAGGENGTMLRWNGSSWSAMPFPSTGSVYGVWGTSGTNVYAVTSNAEVLRYNGSTWSTVTTAASPLWGVFGSSASDVYVSGENGAVMRFNGTSWSSMNTPSSGTMAGVWAGSATNAFTVGTASSGLTGVAFRYNGSTWSSMSMPGTATLTSVWGANANDVYATGESGAMYRWNGSAWSSMSTGTTDLLWAVSGAPTGTGGGFAVGYNSTVAAATSSGSMNVAGLRTSGTATMNLEPRADAKRERGAVPSGKARRQRR